MEYKDSLENYFEDIIGQSSAINFLKAALKKRHIAPAYLFCGPEGVGKKKIAIRFLEGLNNSYSPKKNIRKLLENRNHPDLLWIEPTYIEKGNLIAKSTAENEKLVKNALPQIRLEQIKNIKNFLGKTPVDSKFGMIIIENIETINESAANALLKTLEEPNHGVFILISEKPECLLSTIRSRCQKITFTYLDTNSITKILHKLNLSITIEQKEILQLSNGSPGAILKNIEIWQSIPNEIWPKIRNLSNKTYIDKLYLAKEITDTLNSDTQIWLISWLQQYIWSNQVNLKSIKRLEELRSQLKAFVNPRLAWEIALLQLNQ